MSFRRLGQQGTRQLIKMTNKGEQQYSKMGKRAPPKRDNEERIQKTKMQNKNHLPPGNIRKQ